MFYTTTDPPTLLPGAGAIAVISDTPHDDLLAIMDGLGTVQVPGNVAPIEVGYTIKVLAQSPGQPDPPGGGPLITRVPLHARVADQFHWYSEHRRDLVLVLDDGRRLPLIVTSPDGDAIGQGRLS